MSLKVDTFNTAGIPEKEMASLVKKHFDFRPAAIVKEFDLRMAFSKDRPSTATWDQRTWSLPGREPTRRPARLRLKKANRTKSREAASNCGDHSGPHVV